MATQKKIDTVTKLTDKIGKAKSIVFADFTGLKHKQLEDFRKILEKIESEFIVTKNKLLERALGDNSKNVSEYLKKSTATLFNYADEVSGIKELVKFFKNANLGSVKGGMLGNTVLSQSDAVKLSSVPSREILLGQLARQLNAPIQKLYNASQWNMNKLVWALNSIKEKKVN